MKSITDNLNLSLLEIFAVIFPGGAAILLLLQSPSIQKTVPKFIPLDFEKWPVLLIFTGAAYFAGYVLFFIGSLLDDYVYEYVRVFLQSPKRTDKANLDAHEKLEDVLNTMKISLNNQNKIAKELELVMACIETNPIDTGYPCIFSIDDTANKIIKSITVFERKCWYEIEIELTQGTISIPFKSVKSGKKMWYYHRLVMLLRNRNLFHPKSITKLSFRQKKIKDFLEGKNRVLRQAIDIKEDYPLVASSSVINAYKWSSARLLHEDSGMYAVVERHQTASKFFRSMVLVFAIACPVWWTNNDLGKNFGIVAIVLILLSLLGYLQQRYRAVRTAYEYIVVLESKK